MNAILEELAKEPAAIELLILVVLFFSGSLLFSRLARSTAAIEQAREVRDLVKGLDLFIRGEHAGAAPILRRVVERDPDNVEARAALGDCLREVGDPAEAHRHHFQVAKLLGRDTLVVQLSNARDLLALGRADEAKGKTLEALARARDSAEALRLLRECARASGDLETELDAVRRLLGIDLDAAERRRLETQLPEIEARLGRRLLAHGDSRREAEKLLQSALEKRPTLVRSSADLLAIGSGGGSASATAAVLASLAAPRTGSGESPDRAPAAAATSASERRAALAAVPSAPEREALGSFLARLARFSCRECSAPSRELRVLCDTCGALGTIGEVDGALLKAVPDVAAVRDEIERSPEYLRTLALRAAEGDASAEEGLRRTRPDSIEATLLAATEAREPAALVRALVEIAAESLSGVVDAFVRARAALAARGPIRRAVAPRRSVDPLFVEVLAATANAAAIERLLTHSDAAVRSSALDAVIQAGHAEALERFAGGAGAAPLVRERIGKFPGRAVSLLLVRVRPGGVLARDVLVDPALSHDRAIFDAAATAADPAVRGGLLDVLRARAATSPGFLRALLESPDSSLDPAEWERVVAASASETLTRVVFDAAAGAALRLACARTLASRGAAAIDPVLDALDASGEKGLPTAVAVLSGLGSVGGPALAARPEMNEKAGLFGARRSSIDKKRLRRAAVAEALARLGGPEAARAIRRAAEAAKDEAERSRLDGLARRAEGGGGAAS